MSVLAIALFGLVVVGYAAGSHRLDHAHVTAPMVFTTVGTVMGLVHGTVDPSLVHNLAEATLAVILFHDAAQVRPRQLRGDAALPTRLLLVGLPLTVLLGYGTALLLLPDIGVWLALLLAAALAPTDAGLGAATVLNPVVPVRIRRALNVESGLNDGLATPVVLFAIAAAGGAEAGSRGSFGAALGELVVGVLVGAIVGSGGGRLLSWARGSGHLDEGLLTVGTLGVPLACYYGSLALNGNGFVAAFVSGTAFAAGFAARARESEPEVRREEEHALDLTAWVSTLLGFAVWTLFGVVGIAQLDVFASWRGAVFALLALTVLRMLPVAVALLGSGLQRPSRLFIGWFGPRGLASVVFALIAVEELADEPGLRVVVGSMILTVLFSIVLHGATADSWARRYGAWAGRVRPSAELHPSVEPARGRGGMRGQRPSAGPAGLP